jgi:hypothetical protein
MKEKINGRHRAWSWQLRGQGGRVGLFGEHPRFAFHCLQTFRVTPLSDMSFPFQVRPVRFCRGLRLLLFILCSQRAMAQVYYLDISKQTLALPERSMYVEQVVDGRAGKPASIGTIYKGLNDKSAPVLFRQSLETEFTAWLGQQLPARPTDRPVLLCVRQLLVSETVTNNLLGGNTTATAQLAVDLYIRRPEGYQFIGSRNAQLNRPGISMNADHALHVAQLLQQCLAVLTVADLTAAAGRPSRSLAQVLATATAGPTKAAILRAARPRRGVYFSFEQFIANQPDTAAQVRIDTVRGNTLRAKALGTNTGTNGLGWEGTILLRAKVRANGSLVPMKQVWGFADGNQAFVRQGNLYRPLNRLRDFYTYVGAAPMDYTASRQRVLGSGAVGLGGVAGRPITGAIDTPEDDTGQPMVFALNMSTGYVAPYPPLGQPLPHDTAFIYVYRPASGPAEAQPILLNDHVVGKLLPGQYLELMWPHFGQAVRLSMGTAGGHTLLVVPNTATANYIRLLPGATLTPWHWMPAKQGEAEVDALERPGK